MGEKISVCLVGAAGKMGKAIADALEPGLLITSQVDVQEGYPGFKNLDEVDPSQVDVVINFTNPESTLESARWCAKNKIPLVIL